MDGMISTSQTAGPAQQAASIPFRSPSVGPPEKVPPVSGGNRSRSTVRDEAGLPGKMNGNPAARARWAEVNKEALEANARPGQSLPDPTHEAAPAEGRDITDTRRVASIADLGFSSKALDPTAPSGKNPPDVGMGNGLQRQLTIRFENLATSLSNPHPTQPLIDVFI